MRWACSITSSRDEGVRLIESEAAGRGIEQRNTQRQLRRALWVSSMV